MINRRQLWWCKHHLIPGLPINGKRTGTRTSRMQLRGLGNLRSSAVYNQEKLTSFLNTISCGLQSLATKNRVNLAGT